MHRASGDKSVRFHNRARAIAPLVRQKRYATWAFRSDVGDETRPTSAGGDVDLDRHAVGQHVEHCRASLRLLDQLGQLLGRAVAGDGEVHPDPLEPVAHLVGDAEDAAQVDVALDGRGDLGQRDAAGGGDVAEAAGQAGGRGPRAAARPGWGRCPRRRARPGGRRARVWSCGPGVLLAGAVEAVDRGLVVRAADPAVAGARNWKRPSSGCSGDQVDGGEQGGGVDAVAGGDSGGQDDPFCGGCRGDGATVERSEGCRPAGVRRGVNRPAGPVRRGRPAVRPRRRWRRRAGAAGRRTPRSAGIRPGHR